MAQAHFMTNAPHILIYSDDPGLGGVAQYNHALACALRAAHYSVTLALPHCLDANIPLREQLGIRHAWIPYDTVKDFSRTLQDRVEPARIFRESAERAGAAPDLIVFSNTSPPANLAAKQCALEQGRAFIVVEGFVAPYLAERFATFLPVIARHYAAAREVIAVSSENLHLLRTLFRLPPGRGRVVHYGRPPEYFAPRDVDARRTLRAEHSIPEDALLAFTAARLESVKGYQYQLQAIEQLRTTDLWPSLYFAWAGEGAMRDTLTEAIRRGGLSDHVKLLGERNDVADWLSAADMFLLPSEAEGMPLAIMEAMAHGLPVAASAVSGIPEELGETGRLLPSPTLDPAATVRELISAITSWATDPDRARRDGQACRRRAERYFQEARMNAETIQIIARALLPEGDYVSPGLSLTRPDAAFPHMTIGDKAAHPWPYLRKQVPHNWYVDRRHGEVGFLSRDEAHILYNSALLFKGKRALEIGAWKGWSACHLALGGVQLDVIDPLLARPEFIESVTASLAAAGVLQSVNLVPGYSPAKVRELAQAAGQKWSLLFIDGNHDAPAPLEDAIACEPCAEADALVLLHDLNSPDVAAALDHFRDRGWHTRVYQTMQIMGVAWRGNVQPVDHTPDPRVAWELPAHLQSYSISGHADLALAGAPGFRNAGLTVHAPQFAQAIADHLRRVQEGADDPDTLAFLRDARQALAGFWLSARDDQVGFLLKCEPGRSHALLAGSVAHVLDEEVPAWLEKAAAILAKGPTAPGFAPTLLAASLYRRADQLPLPVTLAGIPDDFLEPYLRFIIAQPLVFTRTGEVDRYYEYLKNWVDLLHAPVREASPSDQAQRAALCFAQFHNFIPLYFCNSDLKEINSQRADLIEMAVRSWGIPEHAPAPRSAAPKRLKLGILAAHFAPQTETFHALPYYEHVDREKVEVILYPLQLTRHPMEQYCFSRADRVAALPGSFPEQVEAIRRDDLDLLAIATNVGALTHSVALLASHRLARAQFTFFSSPVTTGMRHIDYFISGALSEPQAAQAHYREKLLLLEGTGFCFAYAADPAPPAAHPTRADFGIPEPSVVFASGANYYKIIPETIEAWARIVAAVPNARLLLYPFGPAWSNFYPAAPFMRQVYGAFARQGLGADRLIVLPAQPNRATVQQCLKRCDVYLDSLRHAGGHSLVDPLEVGLPTLTLEGPLLRSRHGAAILRSLHLDGLVARDLPDYERLAIDLGRNAIARADWSQKVRAAMAPTPAFLDSKRFGATLTDLYARLANETAPSHS